MCKQLGARENTGSGSNVRKQEVREHGRVMEALPWRLYHALTYILEYLSHEAVVPLFLPVHHLKSCKTSMTAFTATDLLALGVQHPNPHKYQTTISMTAYRHTAILTTNLKQMTKLVKTLQSLYELRHSHAY